MKRRDFIKLNFVNNDTPISILEQKTSALSKEDAYHLLRRVGFAPSIEQVKSISGLLPSVALDKIISDSTEVAVPSSQLQNWIDTPDIDPLKEGTVELRFQAEDRLKQRYNEFINWWLDLMRLEDSKLKEKFTLFWSTVWTIEFTYDTLSLIPPPLIYRNNQTLRKNIFSDYKTISEEIMLDGAMLLYQSLFYSTKEAPNENFMRELMELFTMGVGNYTEGDIREGSRALTGWRTAAYAQEPHPNGYHETYFDRDSHDTEAKTIMNTTIPAIDDASNNEFQVREKEVKGLINILFDKRGGKIGKFVSEKAYKYFVYSNPGSVDNTFIEELTTTFVLNDFSTIEVFKTIFTSELFYNANIRGCQLKTPPEYIIGLERLLDLNYANSRNAIFNLEQVLYDPPNVGSWAGYRTWISTKTFPLRIKYGLEMLEQINDPDLVTLAKKFEDYTDVDMLLDALLQHWLPVAVLNKRRTDYLEILLNGIEISNWEQEITNGTVAEGIRNLLTEIIKSPDFQLT